VGVFDPGLLELVKVGTVHVDMLAECEAGFPGEKDLPGFHGGLLLLVDFTPGPEESPVVFVLGFRRGKGNGFGRSPRPDYASSVQRLEELQTIRLRYGV